MSNSAYPYRQHLGRSVRERNVLRVQGGKRLQHGDVVRWNLSTKKDGDGFWTLADARHISFAEVIGVVEVTDKRSSLCNIVLSGEIKKIPSVKSGVVHFLSTTPGQLTDTPPSAASGVVKPIVLGLEESNPQYNSDVPKKVVGGESRPAYDIVLNYVGHTYDPNCSIKVGELMHAGTVRPWLGSETNVPNGWLLCDGSCYHKEIYPDLFSQIGYTFGTGYPSSDGQL